MPVSGDYAGSRPETVGIAFSQRVRLKSTACAFGCPFLFITPVPAMKLWELGFLSELGSKRQRVRSDTRFWFLRWFPPSNLPNSVFSASAAHNDSVCVRMPVSGYYAGSRPETVGIAFSQRVRLKKTACAFRCPFLVIAPVPDLKLWEWRFPSELGS